jgi:hypothetical protein
MSIISGLWFGTFFIFPIILGMSSSQLTFNPSFFRGVGQPPTSAERRFVSLQAIKDIEKKIKDSLEGGKPMWPLYAEEVNRSFHKHQYISVLKTTRIFL